MLQAMRNGTSSTVLKLFLFGLLMLAMLGLAFTDVTGMFRQGISSNNVVATIDGIKISTLEFDRLVQTTLRQQNIPVNEATRTGMPRQILQREIDNRVFTMAARDLGLYVEDKIVAGQVKEILAPLVAQGLSEKEALAHLLRSSGLSEPLLVSTLKSQIAVENLMKAIASGAKAPEQMLKDALKYKYEARKGEYFTLTTADAGKIAPPSDDELKTYYQTVAAQFALPEYRSFSVLMLDAKSLGIDIKISPEELQAAYEDRKSDYETPETRVISQAIAPDEETAKKLAAADIKEFQKTAEAVKASFIKSATYTQNEIAVEVSEAAFANDAGKILPPIKSPLGWHVLYIEKINPASSRPLEEVKADLEKELFEDKSGEKLYARANEIDDMLAGGQSIGDVANELGLTPIVLETVDAGGLDKPGQLPKTSNFPQYDIAVDNAFTLEEGNVSQLLETTEGGFMIVGTTKITHAEEQPLEKVRDRVLQSWDKQKQQEQLDKKVTDISGRLQNNGDFQKIAAELDKKIQTTDFIPRGSLAENKAKYPAGLIPALFCLDKTGAATRANGGSADITLVRLLERKSDIPQDKKEDIESLQSLLNQSLQNDLLEQYRLSLMQKYNVVINDKAIEALYRPNAEEEE